MAMKHLRKSGRYTGGFEPYGYRRVEGELQAVPEELKVIQLAQRLREEGVSYGAIGKRLSAVTKNAAAGYTYFSLWCRSFDAQVIDISTPADVAAESGFSGERAVYAWRQRMKALRALGFIDCHAGTHDYQYVLLLNPHKVIKKMKDEIPSNLYRQLFSRALDIGAKDMTDEVEKKAEPASLL